MPLTRTNKIVYGGIAALAVVAGSFGIAYAVKSEHDKVSYTSSVQVPGSLEADAKTDDAEDAALADMAGIDLIEAITNATDTAPGKAIEAELDDEHGNLVYEVEIVTDDGIVEVVVDAGDGEILDQKNKHKDAKDAARADAAEIDLIEAITNATDAVPGKAIEAELEDEHGSLVYEVKIVTDNGTVEVIVDADNGKVVNQPAAQDNAGEVDEGARVESTDEGTKVESNNGGVPAESTEPNTDDAAPSTTTQTP